MGIINVLSPGMANLIAAGEVVDRPGSVVKELIENSIDAGSRRIEVEIKNGGVSYIRISDDGSGVEREDISKMFLRHATSKIKDPEDLQRIATMGFRGEALAAISAVSRVDLFTRTEGSVGGLHITCEGGQTGEPVETGCPKGTTITVRDLFYNVPARMKFMKKDQTEASYCENAVVSAALAHPDISFKFKKDGREVFFSSGGGSLLKVIAALVGSERASRLLPVDGDFPGGKIKGYVSAPSDSRGTRAMQYFLVNGRPVRGKILTAAIDSAFKGKVMPGRYPAVFLSITVPYSAVDVNVHPAKLEVKFAHEKDVFGGIYGAVSMALEGGEPFPRFDAAPQSRKPRFSDPSEDRLTGFQQVMGETARKGTEKYDNALSATAPTGQTKRKNDTTTDAVGETFGYPPTVRVEKTSDGHLFAREDSFDVAAKVASPSLSFGDFGLSSKNTHKIGVEIKYDGEPSGLGFGFGSEKKQPVSFEEAKTAGATGVGFGLFLNKNAPETEKALQEEGRKNAVDEPIKVIGQVFNTYIIAQQGEGMWLIDKHAAHERLIYNDLEKKIGAQDMQTLMEPHFTPLAPDEKQACLDGLDVLEKMGFELEDYGLGGLSVRRLPVYLDEENIDFVLSDMAQKLMTFGRDMGGEKAKSPLLDELIKSISCKAAVKGGSYSDIREMEHLARQVLERDDVRNCPHGRPVAVFVTRYQLEKQFKRIV